MKRIIIVGAIGVLCALASPAIAQQQQYRAVTIPGALAMALVQHLLVGGTISAGQNLAQQLGDAAAAPARAEAEEKALRAKIAAEAKPAPSAPGAPRP